MRILAVDPGSVRVGVALSDEGEVLASPLATLRAGRGLASRIIATAREAGAGMVVLGLPLRLDGTDGPEAVAARDLAGEVASLGITVELCDERFTSVMAEAALRQSRPGRGARATAARRADVDQVAAAVLLQSFLDGRRSRAAAGGGPG